MQPHTKPKAKGLEAEVAKAADLVTVSALAEF
jgi:hypothetical protein